MINIQNDNNSVLSKEERQFEGEVEVEVEVEDEAVEDEAVEDEAVEDEAVEDEAVEDEVEKGKAEEGKAEEGKAEEGKAEEGKAEEGKAEETSRYDGLSKSSLFTIASVVFTISVISTLYIFGFNSSTSVTFSRMIDITSLCALLVIFTLIYYVTNKKKKYEIIDNSVDNVEKLLKGQNFLGLVFSILVLYLVIFISGVPMTNDTKPITILVFESLLWMLILSTIFIQLIKFLFDTNLRTIIFDNLRRTISYVKKGPNERKKYREDKKDKDKKDKDKKDKDKKDKDKTGKDKDLKTGEKVESEQTKSGIKASSTGEKGSEVFHVSNNLYNYEEAQAVCASFSSRLATYDEIEQSYNKGGEFCGYGWSDGQMILFPTQKSTYDKLQLLPGHGNDCGRTGVNGGFMSNPNTQHGVNCYGKKPEGIDPSPEKSIVQKNEKDIINDAKVKYWQKHKDQMLKIDSFNKTKWSEY
jgi:hypothetical protein